MDTFQDGRKVASHRVRWTEGAEPSRRGTLELESFQQLPGIHVYELTVSGHTYRSDPVEVVRGTDRDVFLRSADD